MIYIFGDSWGFSYRQKEPQTADRDSQVFHGADLSSLLMQLSDRTVTNLCLRGASNASTFERIKNARTLFAEGDQILVLQTDPLRSIFVPWYSRPMVSQVPAVTDTPFAFTELCDRLLQDFYTKLHMFSLAFRIPVLLHGGISKVNQQLAAQIGLECTDQSSTEIICPGFVDNYFIESRYVLANHDYLKDNTNYVSNDVHEIAHAVDQKNLTWHARPKYFTHNHPTEAGSMLVAEYLHGKLYGN